MQTTYWNKLSAKEQEEALSRPIARSNDALKSYISDLFGKVQTGDVDIIIELSRKYDGAEPQVLSIDESLVEKAKSEISVESYAALKQAYENIYAFHNAEKWSDYEVETSNGVFCGRRYRALNSVGLYIPGGTAPLFSTILMLAIPAKIAGVQNIILCTPPAKVLHPMIILAAQLCGLDKIYLIGGAQAVAAMTYGTSITPKVDLIAGPGNAYVTAAKSYAGQLQNGPAIDMPAGPSELMVIADITSNAEIVAADLLSQAEHDEDAQVLVVSSEEEILDDVIKNVEEQLLTLPRQAIARRAMVSAQFIKAASSEEAIQIANIYAPEHLSLNLKNAETYLDKIYNVGTVFVGECAAETFGDYNAGPSHVLPTDGAARNWSGVTVSTFLKSFSVQKVTKTGISQIAENAATLARLEGLEGHARAADIRLTLLKETGE